MAHAKRRNSVAVNVGGILVGGGAPVVVQSMTNTDTADACHPDLILQAAAAGAGAITGGGLANPSIHDSTQWIAADPDRAALLKPHFLYDFVHGQAQEMADYYFEGDQYWPDSGVTSAGAFDPAAPWNASGQDPKITVVHGDLHLSGGFSGGGLLIVTGTLFCSGALWVRQSA